MYITSSIKFTLDVSAIQQKSCLTYRHGITVNTVKASNIKLLLQAARQAYKPVALQLNYQDL